VPKYAYPTGLEVEVSDGTWEHAPAEAVLRYQPERPGGVHRIVVRPPFR
jgi:hypothetical protein